MIEVRGDEALVVFESARQAIRAAMDLQKQFAQETKADPDLPLRVGIGIDSGEAIALEDGTFRGAALNVAARLCAIAHGGEVLVSDGTSHLAGRLPGVRYIDRGRVHLKGIEGAAHVVLAAPEEQPESRQRTRLSLPSPKRLGWGLGLIVVLIAAVTATAVVYLTGGNQGEPGAAAPGSETGSKDARRASVIALMPAGLAQNCIKQPAANVGGEPLLHNPRCRRRLGDPHPPAAPGARHRQRGDPGDRRSRRGHRSRHTAREQARSV